MYSRRHFKKLLGIKLKCTIQQLYKKCVSPIFPCSSVEIGDSQVAGEKGGYSDYSNSDGHKGN